MAGTAVFGTPGPPDDCRIEDLAATDQRTILKLLGPSTSPGCASATTCSAEKKAEPEIENAPAHPMTFKWDSPNVFAFQNP